MKNNFIRLSLKSLISTLLFSGCLEHNYDITVNKDGSVDTQWSIQGDKVDIDDGLDQFPDSIRWNVIQLIEESENETSHRIEGKARLDNPLELNDLFNWDRSIADTVHLRKNFNLIVHRNPVYSKWQFRGKFQSRDYTAKYGDLHSFIPPECSILNDEEETKRIPSSEIEALEKKFALGVIQWNLARYEKTFDRVWNNTTLSSSVLSDKESDEYSITRSGWADDLRVYMNNLDIPKPEYVNLD